MGDAKTKNRESISGKSGRDLAVSILERIKRIIERMNKENQEISKLSNLTNIKDILHDIREDYTSIIATIDDALSSKTLEIEGPEEYEKSPELLEHLLQDVPETDPNDLRSVLLNTIKKNRDLQHILNLMGSEYNVKSVKSVISKIMEHLNMAGSKLEGLYEDLINRDYW